jgi:hypothetical protein
VQNKTTILAVSGATILVCLCLCGFAFLFLSVLGGGDIPAGEYPGIPATEPAQREYPEYPLPGPDKSPVPLTDIPEGGLGNYDLRRDVWVAILSVTQCDPLSPSEVFIEIESREQLTEFWTLYCIYDPMEIYHVIYEEEPGGGVNFYVTKRPPYESD